ncbi:MAG: U32 family peptidase [Bacteroidales bacterium]|nr:U32 family peptidase [Bacteroidales bacterium]
MAPVGSFPALQAAVQAGAGAVYFGVGKLNMRARAALNFQVEDLEEICRICREHHIKTYLTLNTVIYDEEIEQSRQVLEEAKKAGVSAVISSDWSVIGYARSIGLHVHISTQCNITNIEAVKFYAQFADVMVLARELSLAQVAEIIRQINEQNICGPSGEKVRIEIFVHGALCMAVSGKCYLSLDYYNSSANRGSCLQLCRRPYKLSQTDGEKDVEIEVDNAYLLSPKDLKTVDLLDRLIATGIRVLKIEGRGRAADYVKTVTEVYKEAVAACADGSYGPEKIAHWNERLGHVYHRGFWEGYYMGKKTGEWSTRYGSSADRKKTYVGIVANYFSRLKVAEIKVEAGAFSVGDELTAIGPRTGAYETTVPEIRVDLVPVQTTRKGESCSIPVSEPVRKGDKVYRVDKADYPTANA